jgi:hypothetical protein
MAPKRGTWGNTRLCDRAVAKIVTKHSDKIGLSGHRDSEHTHLAMGAQLDIALAVLLALLCGSLFLYLSHALVAAF